MEKSSGPLETWICPCGWRGPRSALKEDYFGTTEVPGGSRFSDTVCPACGQWLDNRAREAHRRFTLVGGGSLRGDPEGAWTTHRNLEEKVATERARIRRELIDVVADQREEWALARPIGVEMVKSEREMGADAAFLVVLNALNRICPEEG